MNIQDIEKLISEGFKIRKKKIKGKAYAYSQKGSEYHYLERWSRNYARFITEPDVKQEEHEDSFGSLLGDYKAYLKQLEDEAKLEGVKLIEYIDEVIFRVNSKLYSKFLTLTGKEGLLAAYAEGVKLTGSYLERVKSAHIRGEKAPNFLMHVTEVMESYLKSAIENMKGKFAKPGNAVSYCPSCGELLEYKMKNRQLHPLTIRPPGYSPYMITLKKESKPQVVCSVCGKEYDWSCQICDSKMRFIIEGDGGFLQCDCCFWRKNFAETIRVALSEDDIFLAYINKTKDSRLNRYKIVLSENSEGGIEFKAIKDRVEPSLLTDSSRQVTLVCSNNANTAFERILRSASRQVRILN